MNAELAQLLNQLTVVQLSAQSLALQCDQLITQLSAAEAEASAPQAPAASPSTGCSHPAQLRDHTARTMGQPHRFLCRQCGELVNDVPSQG